MPANVTKLEYRVWRQVDEVHPGDDILQVKGQLSMADYHFRVNAGDAGIDPLSISTHIEWTGELECRFTIEAPASEEVLSAAWKKAVELMGLRTEQVPTAA
jgi:hypothetical protein